MTPERATPQPADAGNAGVEATAAASAPRRSRADTDITVEDLQSMRSPFDELIGLQFHDVEPGRLEARLDAEPRLHQPFGIVHGGVYAALVETVASVGAWVSVHRSGAAAVGVHNATDFIRPHVEGPLRIIGREVHAGRTQHLWQVDVSREVDGKLVARGQVRLAVIPPDED